jgi:hypothetical protein
MRPTVLRCNCLKSSLIRRSLSKSNYSLKVYALYFRDNKFHVFPQKSFVKEVGRQNEIEARVIKDGLAKGVRVRSDDMKKIGLMLQVESKFLNLLD